MPAATPAQEQVTLEPQQAVPPSTPGLEPWPSHKAQQKSRVLNCKSSPTWGLADKKPGCKDCWRRPPLSTL